MTRAKAYYQCLLDWDGLKSVGLLEMRSDQPQAYYKVLLQHKLVPSGLGSAKYLRILDGESVEAAIASIEDGRVDAIHGREGSRDDEWASGSDDILEAGNEEEERALPLPPSAVVVDGEAAPANDDVAASCSSGSSSGSISESSSGDGVAGPAPKTLDGCRLREEVRHSAVDGYRRYIISCRWHARCYKKRNAGPRQTNALGAKEPLAYLGAWHRLGRETPSKRAHARMRPTLVQQRSFMAEL